MLKNGGTKAPVMILFFNRPDNLKQVFEAVRKYSPEQLFLVQDGARVGRPDDIDNINKCREIVDTVDWKCEVYRNYAEENMSCDHREYTGIDWCFQYVDRLIILEDDCVPTQGFMKLCEECLEKYKDETSIHSIYGFNRLGYYECPYDYVFSKTGAGWGWATWKRVWDRVNAVRNSKLFSEPDTIKYINNSIEHSVKEIYGDFVKDNLSIREKEIAQGKIISWEHWCGVTLILYNMVTIVPKKNMIRYIGISQNATHTADDPKLLPRKVRNVLTQKAYESEEIISHPPCIIRDSKFEKLSKKSMYSFPVFSKFEHIFLILRYKGFKQILIILKNKISKVKK